MDPKAADKLDDTDTVRLQNIGLRQEILNKEREEFGRYLSQKYADGGAMQVAPDGTLTRTTPPVPPTVKTKGKPRR